MKGPSRGNVELLHLETVYTGWDGVWSRIALRSWLAKVLHLKPRERVRNIVIFSRDMYCTKVEIMSWGTEGKVPDQVHDPGDFGFPRINNLGHTQIVTMELNALGRPMGPPQVASDIDCK